jgi:uncharacterized protein (DUF2336 family)
MLKMTAQDSLISELEESIRADSNEKRVQTLRKVTDLFLTETDRFNDQQINVFDDVLLRLIERVEAKALAELSRRLAPIPNAPNDVIQKLARNDEILVASPVLMHSPRLRNANLVEIASTKSQAHSLAISCRDQLEIPVTDVLVRRGDRNVLYRLTKNSGAAFSEASFTTLVERAENDDSFVLQLGRRLDIPLQLFRELLQRATEAVRAKLLALIGERQTEIQSVLAQVSDQLIAENAAPRDYTAAMRLVRILQKKGELNQDAILTFLRANQYEELVVAFSVLCGLPFDLIDHLMHVPRSDALLIPCKAVGFDWATTRAILKNRPILKQIAPDELDIVWGECIKLSRATAQRVMRFLASTRVSKDIDTYRYCCSPVCSVTKVPSEESAPMFPERFATRRREGASDGGLRRSLFEVRSRSRPSHQQVEGNLT